MDLKPNLAALLAVAALALTALAVYFGTGLTPHWSLTWLAPLPILLIAPRMSWWPAWACAFVAFALGSTNVWPYLHTVIELPLSICVLAVAGPALIFSGAVMLFRRFLLKQRPLAAALVFPLLWVAFEYLIEFKNINGTWGNLAYSQSDFLPVMQLASIAGLWGVSFAVLFFSAAIAALVYGKKRAVLFTTALAFYLVVFGFGFWRLHQPTPSPSITVGLISSDARKDIFPQHDDHGLALTAQYASAVDQLAAQGAQLVIIPEKIASMSDEGVSSADAILSQAARRNHIYLLYGVDHRIADKTFNQSRLFSPAGDRIASYDKHHLVPRMEDIDTPGSARVVKDLAFGRIGLTVCKDMDFPLLSRQYGQSDVALLLVPAWDFEVDRWLHDRMTVVRGIESGFSIARSAKQGILSVSDNRGRILAERTTDQLPFSSLVASVPVAHANTLYARFGDWFAWLVLLALAALLLTLFQRRTVPLSRNDAATESATPGSVVHSG